jgi:hypothetical protein
VATHTQSKYNTYNLIDYLKILSFNKDLAERLFSNTLLSKYSKSSKFYNSLNKEQIEIIKQSTHTYSYKEILFCFFEKDNVFTKLEILIKPHYYFNNNEHNANTFSAIDSIKTLTEIKDKFNLPVDELLILNIEFGINAISPIDCKNLISYAVYHEKNEFINSSDSLRFSKISFKHHSTGKANNYKQIKFYAKGIQCPQFTDINTFRFEVKSKQRKYIKSIGIKTYNDLLRWETYNILFDVLKNEFSKVLILDIDNNKQNLSSKESEKLNQCLNSVYWMKSLQGSRNLFSINKKKYFKLLDKTENNIHSKMSILFDEKIKEILKKCAVSTPPKKQKECAISDVYIIGNCTQTEIRKCIVTGIELHREKQGSNYIKTTTLKHLRKHDKYKYEEVCSLLLSNSNTNHTKFENNIISHLVKQVRNRFYNKNTIKNIGYNKKQYENQYKMFF